MPELIFLKGSNRHPEVPKGQTRRMNWIESFSLTFQEPQRDDLSSVKQTKEFNIGDKELWLKQMRSMPNLVV